MSSSSSHGGGKRNAYTLQDLRPGLPEDGASEALPLPPPPEAIEVGDVTERVERLSMPLKASFADDDMETHVHDSSRPIPPPPARRPSQGTGPSPQHSPSPNVRPASNVPLPSGKGGRVNVATAWTSPSTGASTPTSPRRNPTPAHSAPAGAVFQDYTVESPGQADTMKGDISRIMGGSTDIGGRYQLEEPIGEGGMGRVFRVRHTRLAKFFALKLMRANFSHDPRLRELFYREARLASSLAHPNVVSIIDFGEDPRLGAFMVMELLEGETLSNRLRGEGRFPLRMVCETILQVAEALHYIHGRQIIHCDIKPDNILLCAVPGMDRRRYAVKLLDFGLARPRVRPDGRVTAVVDGTPAYLAPERIRGHEPVPSMDIYSLGVLCYELLTGDLPFTGSVTEIMEAHVRTPPTPISQRMKEPVDERVEALVMRSLEKDPKNRQKDMAAFIYELRTLMDMLGFGRRNRGVTSAARIGGHPKRRRERGAGVAFELSPLPTAILTVDGQVVVANRAFARFMTGDKAADVEGTDIYGTKLVEVHSEFSADLRSVHISTNALQRILRLRAQDGGRVNLMLWMVPVPAGEEKDAGDVLVTIHSLDAPEED